jgi:hypothetical protein
LSENGGLCVEAASARKEISFLFLCHHDFAVGNSQAENAPINQVRVFGLQITVFRPLPLEVHLCLLPWPILKKCPLPQFTELCELITRNVVTGKSFLKRNVDVTQVRGVDLLLKFLQ